MVSPDFTFKYLEDIAIEIFQEKTKSINWWDLRKKYFEKSYKNFLKSSPCHFEKNASSFFRTPSRITSPYELHHNFFQGLFHKIYEEFFQEFHNKLNQRFLINFSKISWIIFGPNSIRKIYSMLQSKKMLKQLLL